MKSIHDNEIKNYFVDFEKKEIRMKVFSEEKINKEIVFKNVFSHKFYNDMPYSIILDLEERPLSSFFKRNKELLLEGKRDFWPIDFDTMNDLEKEIEKQNQKYWILSSSYGLRGWVLCEEIEILTLK